MSALEIKSINDADWIAEFLVEHWGADYLVTRGRRIESGHLTGAQALAGGKPVGLITWQIKGEGTEKEMEIVTLDSYERQSGVGSFLLEHAVAIARVSGVRRVWLVTTNDNLDALRFYQRRGMRLCAIHKDAVTEARKQKPEIPEIGNFGIPLWDEVELERVLK